MIKEEFNRFLANNPEIAGNRQRHVEAFLTTNKRKEEYVQQRHIKQVDCSSGEGTIPVQVGFIHHKRLHYHEHQVRWNCLLTGTPLRRSNGMAYPFIAYSVTGVLEQC
jgi:desulfoferrodoxin (superoxide reductase-like protein)